MTLIYVARCDCGRFSIYSESRAELDAAVVEHRKGCYQSSIGFDALPIGGKGCDCEHASHFPWATAHDYGEGEPHRDVKTAYGTFHLCRPCLEAGHLVDEEITP